MALLYLTYFYVLNIITTTVTDKVTANLEIYTEQCCEMIDDIEKIVKALCIKADIAEVKKSILTDKGFYVPDELLKEGVCSIDQLGTYPHADTDIKKSMHANKALMDDLNAKTIELMAFLNHCTDQIPHSVITKLLYDIMRFNCRESWILLRIYKDIDDCDAKLKKISDNPHATNSDASISDILALNSITLSRKFVFWQEDMEKRKKDILTQIITYKREIDKKSAQDLTLEIDITFDNLKLHCNSVKTYAEDLKLVLHILDSLNNTDCSRFISDLDGFVRNLIISGILTANLLAKEAKNYISLYGNIKTKRDFRRDILNLERNITPTIHSILETNKGLVERYKAIIEIYNDGNKGNIFRPLDANCVMELIFNAYYDVLERIQGVTGNRIPFSYSDKTGITYDTHENCTCD